MYKKHRVALPSIVMEGAQGRYYIRMELDRTSMQGMKLRNSEKKRCPSRSSIGKGSKKELLRRTGSRDCGKQSGKKLLFSICKNRNYKSNFKKKI